jgi:hypothetical protein
LSGREFGIWNDDAIHVFAEGFGLGTKNDIKDFLNFESGLGLRGPETILGRNELVRTIVFLISFEVTLSDIAID